MKKPIVALAASAAAFALGAGVASAASLVVGQKYEYDVEKGTIRFPFDRPVPTALIARIARLRVEEVAAKAGATGPRKRRPRS